MSSRWYAALCQVLLLLPGLHGAEPPRAASAVATASSHVIFGSAMNALFLSPLFAAAASEREGGVDSAAEAVPGARASGAGGEADDAEKHGQENHDIEVDGEGFGGLCGGELDGVGLQQAARRRHRFPDHGRAEWQWRAGGLTEEQGQMADACWGRRAHSTLGVNSVARASSTRPGSPRSSHARSPWPPPTANTCVSDTVLYWSSRRHHDGSRKGYPRVGSTRRRSLSRAGAQTCTSTQPPPSPALFDSLYSRSARMIRSYTVPLPPVIYAAVQANRHNWTGR